MERKKPPFQGRAGMGRRDNPYQAYLDADPKPTRGRNVDEAPFGKLIRGCPR